jgi:hypothetical protein
MIRGFAKCEALSDVDALAFVEFELPGGTDHIVTLELVKSIRNNEESSIERAELCFSGLLVNNILGRSYRTALFLEAGAGLVQASTLVMARDPGSLILN